MNLVFNNYTTNFEKRMHRAISYIDENIKKNLSLEEIANFAAFSKYHFHRQFLYCFGMNVFEYIRYLKIKQICILLSFNSETITEIGLDYGFETSDNFSRCFKKIIGKSPSKFRKNPDWDKYSNLLDLLDKVQTKAHIMQTQNYNVEIVEFSGVNIASLKCYGIKELAATIPKLVEWRIVKKLHPSKYRTFNVFHSHDEIITTEIGVEYYETVDHHEIKNSAIPEGKCAKLRIVGKDSGLEPAIMYLYQDWLPNSGEELRDFPIFRELVKFFPMVSENEAISDIYLPLL